MEVHCRERLCISKNHILLFVLFDCVVCLYVLHAKDTHTIHIFSLFLSFFECFFSSLLVTPQHDFSVKDVFLLDPSSEHERLRVT